MSEVVWTDSVAHVGLHRGQWTPGLHQPRRARVPQVVNTRRFGEPGDFGASDGRPPHARLKRVDTHRAVVGADLPVGEPAFAATGVGEHPLAPQVELGKDTGGDVDGAHRLLGFRDTQRVTASPGLPRLGDPHRPGLHVDRGRLERGGLTVARVGLECPGGDGSGQPVDMGRGLLGLGFHVTMHKPDL